MGETRRVRKGLILLGMSCSLVKLPLGGYGYIWDGQATIFLF